MYSYILSIHQNQYKINDINILYILVTTNLKTVFELDTKKIPIELQIYKNFILQESYTFNFEKKSFYSKNNIEFNFLNMNDDYVKFRNSLRNEKSIINQKPDQKEELKQKILMLENKKKKHRKSKKRKIRSSE